MPNPLTRKITLSLSMLILAEGALAETLSPKFDSIFYYRLGGARVFNAAPRLEVETLNLSIKGSITGLECGKFDPMVSIDHTFNRLKDGMDSAMNRMEAAASAAIAALPGYILQQYDPGLYDLFMNTLFRAEESFSLATKSCEKMQAEIRKGTDPFEEFVTVSIGDVWKASAGLPGVNIHDVASAAESDAARANGFRWVGGTDAGGEGMEPGWLISDTAKAGYNMILNRSPEDESGPPLEEDSPPLVKKFTDPSEVEEWVKLVLGDTFVASCMDCNNGTRPGAGLRSLIEDKKPEVMQKLQSLYDGSDSPTLDNLEAASSDDIVITRQVIETLQRMENTDASIYLSRMVDEIAMSLVVNEALLIQQIIRTGKRESNLVGHQNLQELTAAAIEQIDDEIDSVLKENRIKQQLVSSTIREALVHGRAESFNSRSISQPGMRDPNTIGPGGVVRD